MGHVVAVAHRAPSVMLQETSPSANRSPPIKRSAHSGNRHGSWRGIFFLFFPWKLSGDKENINKWSVFKNVDRLTVTGGWPMDYNTKYGGRTHASMPHRQESQMHRGVNGFAIENQRCYAYDTSRPIPVRYKPKVPWMVPQNVKINHDRRMPGSDRNPT